MLARLSKHNLIFTITLISPYSIVSKHLIAVNWKLYRIRQNFIKLSAEVLIAVSLTLFFIYGNKSFRYNRPEVYMHTYMCKNAKLYCPINRQIFLTFFLPCDFFDLTHRLLSHKLKNSFEFCVCTVIYACL